MGESVTQRESNVEKLAHPRALTLSSSGYDHIPLAARGSSGKSPGEPQLAVPTAARRPPQAPAHLRSAPPGRCARHTARAQAAPGGRLTRLKASASRSTRPEVTSPPSRRGRPGSRRPQPGPAHSERRRARPAGGLPGSRSANSGCGRMRRAGLRGAASPPRGSLTHHRRRRPPAPPAPAPGPTAAAPASRPPPPPRPPHSERRRPRPLFPQREGGGDAVGGTSRGGPPTRASSRPALLWTLRGGARGGKPRPLFPCLASACRDPPGPADPARLGRQRGRGSARTLGMLRKTGSLGPLS